MDTTTHKDSRHPHHKSSQTQKAFNVWGIVLAIWAVYRSTIGVSAPLLFDEVVLKPVLFIVPVIFYITQIERKSIMQGLWLDTKNILSNLKVALLISIPVFVLFFLFLIFNPRIIPFDLLIILVPIALGMSISEEVLSRGFVARHIWEEKHGVITTMVQASVLHMFLRIPRIMTMPELFGQKLIFFVAADFLLSIVLTAILLWRKDIISVIVVRFLYSFLLMSMLVS